MRSSDNPSPKKSYPSMKKNKPKNKSKMRETKEAKKSKSFPLHTFSPISPANWEEKIVSPERNLLGPTSFFFLFLIFSSSIQSNGGKLSFTLYFFLIFLPFYSPINQTLTFVWSLSTFHFLHNYLEKNKNLS